MLGVVFVSLVLVCGGTFAGAVELFKMPFLLSRFRAPMFGVADPSPSPSPSPSARATHHSFLGAGPIELSGLGSLDLNTRRNGRNGISQASNSYISSGQIGLQRRTDSAVVSVSQGIGYASGQSAFGQIQANYRTPRYSLDYGAVAGAGETALQIGGFARGIRYAKPTRNGTIEIIGAAAFQQDSTGFRAFGVRRFIQGRTTTATLTLLAANALHGSASNRIGDIVLKHYSQTGSATAEIAVSQPHAIATAPAGSQLAVGVAFDRAGRSGYSSFDAVFEPSGFTSLNQVAPPQTRFQGLVRRDFGRASSLGINLGADRTSTNGTVSSDRLATITLNTLVRGINVTLLDNFSTSRSADQTTINRGLGSIFNETIRGTSFSQSYQLATTDGSGGRASNREVSFNESRELAHGYLNLSQGFGRSASAGALGTFIDTEASYSRPFGKRFDFALTFAKQKQTTNGVSIPTATTTLSLIRRLSSVVAVRVSASVSHQGGLSPGTSTSLNADLVGPFAFGEAARSSGRINPNLPATIRGRVYAVASGTEFTAAAASERGFGNVLVVLDGTITERTDSSGAYEFRFVKPGIHTIAIEPASLSAGLVADRQRQTFKVQGGQIESIDFGVGNFAGVSGRVFARVNGAEVGIPDVVVVVDDLERVVTDSDGRYSIGRLLPGTHRVMVDQVTLPSDASLTGGYATKTVAAVTGTVVVANFRAERLGSIAGTVLFAADNGFGDLKGAKDVYVVANPGDHAAITDPDGSFLIDNLPPGKYTLTVDKETLPDGEDVVQGPDDAVEVVPDAKIGGIVFKLGAGPKEVVFTFNGAKKSPISITSDMAAVPPGAVVNVSVKTGEKTPSSVRLETDTFGNRALTFDKKKKSWIGSFVVPPTVQKGEYALHAAVDGDEKGADTSLKVDPKIPLITLRIAPNHPSPGHTVHVVMRILAPVSEGDALHFSDGYTIELPKPRGRIFSFDIRLGPGGVPYNGSIITREHLVLPLIIK